MAFAFDDRKLLPHGIHETSLKMVEEHFGRFQSSDRRASLFGRLRDYLAAVKRADCGSSVIIDGSFVMACLSDLVGRLTRRRGS